MMLRNFDIFEKFPDGSLTWRACAFGQFEAERKLQELAEHSDNEFLAVDIQSSEPFAQTRYLKSPQAIKKAASG
jgi:hypothetical protein